MGQKVHPVGFRLGITRTWDSRWFEDKQYVEWLHEDLKMRKELDGMSRSAAIAKVEIERRANQARVIINTAKPGIIIGKRGAGIEEIKKKLEKISGKTVSVNVVEIKHPELDAKLVANNIVDQLEKRIAFRRAMRQALQRTMKAGAKGIKVQCGGRLGGAEIARVERNFEGKVPLHTLRANIDYAHSEAYTTFGRIGVKVWIYLGEVLPAGKQAPAVAQPRDTRPPRRPRPPHAIKPMTGPGSEPKPAAGPAPAAEAAPQVGTAQVGTAQVGAPPAEAPQVEASMVEVHASVPAPPPQPTPAPTPPATATPPAPPAPQAEGDQKSPTPDASMVEVAAAGPKPHQKPQPKPAPKAGGPKAAAAPKAAAPKPAPAPKPAAAPQPEPDKQPPTPDASMVEVAANEPKPDEPAKDDDTKTDGGVA